MTHPIQYHVEHTSLVEAKSYAWPAQGLVKKPVLCAGPRSAFAISYDLFISGEEVYVDPDCEIWSAQNQSVLCTEARKEEWVAQDYGHMIFRFLSRSEIRDLAEDMLRRMISESSGETYTFAACADGAVLIAHDAKSVSYHHGASAAVGLFLPPKVSNHQDLECHANLLACATSILSVRWKMSAKETDFNLTRFETRGA